ncbi:hypothetical protein [Streptomyces sp. NPDC093984]|uniref:hypothetical protein n=1 Tax=Streptomyces sp. NPDC093984 TaxID=3366052 RepID=UPI00382B9651
MAADRFTGGVGRDFLDAEGRNVRGDIRLGEPAAAPGVAWRCLPHTTDELLAADVDGLDAVLLAGRRPVAIAALTPLPAVSSG